MTATIKVENLSKAYQIGQIGTGTISRDLERWFTTRILGKEDPFLKLGETNDRTIKGQSDVVWSLKDIDLEVQQGEAVGIIGRNGAGKSTLLKLLSRVTSPTTGRIKIKGRVASLLEVGTGFHPELTGRENVYLNGAILGMRKREIDRKLDEIVDFSGVERYIDTPVKRYSSGMTVRLAFAVAAHLESEILIVDEVLAVGDAEFQKKCLGKMEEVGQKEGRTILFVSHNITSVRHLCRTGLLLENGAIRQTGNVDDVCDHYLSDWKSLGIRWKREETKNAPIYFDEIQVSLSGRQPRLSLEIDCSLIKNAPHKKAFVAFDICDARETPLMQAIPIEEPFLDVPYEGPVSIKSVIQLPPLVPGTYHVSCWIGSHYSQTLDWVRHAVAFEVRDFPVSTRTVSYPKHAGFMVPASTVEVIDGRNDSPAIMSEDIISGLPVPASANTI